MHGLVAELHLIAAQSADGGLDGRQRRAQLVPDRPQERGLECIRMTQGLGLHSGMGEPLALLGEGEHAASERATRRAFSSPRTASVAPMSSSRPITRPSMSSGNATWPASGPRPKTMRAAGTPIAAAATRAASTWASSRLAPPTSALERPGEQRSLALPLVGLLRSPALACGQLGHGGSGQDQRREQQPDAGVGCLPSVRRQQQGVEDDDRRNRGQDAGAQPEEEGHPDHGRQVDEAERVVVRVLRAVDHEDHTRAEEDGERPEDERREGVPARADAGTATWCEAGHAAPAAGQRHAPSLRESRGKPAGNAPIVEPNLPRVTTGGRRSKKVRTTAAALIVLAALVVGAPAAGAHALKARTVAATIDELRGERGCGPLHVDDGLAARPAVARLLLTVGQLDHDAGAPFASRLEQAAPAAAHDGARPRLRQRRGLRSPQAIVAGWMNSPAHRAIMLDCRFSEGRHRHRRRALRGLDGSVYVADFAA